MAGLEEGANKKIHQNEKEPTSTTTSNNKGIIQYYIIIAHAPIEYRNLLLPRYGHIPRGRRLSGI